MRTQPLTLPCTHDDIVNAISELWPKAASGRGVDWPNERAPAPLLDGHIGVGFSIRLFGSGLPGREVIDRAYAALEDMLRAMEDLGFEVTREGNEWQSGRLVLGWAAFRSETDNDLLRCRDVPEGHAANIERRERFCSERAVRDGGARGTGILE